MFKEKKVKKAIFPVAGFGTRFLPATKAMPKELLPILNKPLIQFAVEEAVDADIDTLIFITGRNKRAIEDHFDVNVELSEFLKHSGKSEKIKQIENIIPENITCIPPNGLSLCFTILPIAFKISNIFIDIIDTSSIISVFIDLQFFIILLFDFI